MSAIFQNGFNKILILYKLKIKLLKGLNGGDKYEL